MKGYLVFKT